MDKELKTIGKCFNVSQNEVKIIYDIIASCITNHSYIQLKMILLKVFTTDIKPEHFIILGHLIGYCLATDEMQAKQYNQLSLCQRQN